jgi:hypothetical protein
MTPKSRTANHRLLALDVRPHRLGYAVFETPARLLDFRVTRFDSPHAGALRAASLVGKFGPTTVVLRKIGQRSTRNRPLTRATIRLISRQTRHSSIQVAVVSNRQVTISLGGGRRLTKHQIASLLAQAFPELVWRLPQPRRPWEPEPWNMSIFDAVALGVTYLVSQNDESVLQKSLSVARKSLFAGPSVT